MDKDLHTSNRAGGRGGKRVRGVVWTLVWAPSVDAPSQKCAHLHHAPPGDLVNDFLPWGHYQGRGIVIF